MRVWLNDAMQFDRSVLDVRARAVLGVSSVACHKVVIVCASHELATSGLQILSDADQPWSARVDRRWLRHSAPCRGSWENESGQGDLTLI